MKKTIALLLALMMVLFTAAGCGGGAGGTGGGNGDYPARPITLVVPFDAGGATDLIARAMQAKMKEKLGVDISVQNMSGGSTAVGNQYVLDSEHDGYTILMQATEIANIWSMNQSDITRRDFDYIGMTAAVPGVFVVKKDSPIQTLDDLVKLIKERQISVAVCGGGCAWTLTMGLFVDSIGGISPEYVPMGSGKNAAISAMKGEVEVGSCGIPEVVELLQGGELRAVGCLTEEPVTIDGYGEIPTILDACPELAEFMPYGGFIGMAVPKGTPENVVEALTEAYRFAAEDEAFKQYLADSHFIELGYVGNEAASEYVAMRESLNAWLLYELGIAERNPEDMGIEHF